MLAKIRTFIKKILVFLGAAVGSFFVLFLAFGAAGLYESSGLLSGLAVASVLVLPVVFGALVVRKKFPRVPSATPAGRKEKVEEHIPSTAIEAPAPVLDYKQRRAAYIERKQEEFSLELSKIPRAPVVQSSERTKRANMISMPEIKCSNITRSTNMVKLFPLVVVDTETTGIKPGGNDIIEVSAIKYGPGFVPISCFSTLCKPRKPIPAEATEVNHITDEMVADAPPFALIASAFSEYIAGCNMVGHNLPFDLRFLYISGVELPPKAKYYDTLNLAKKVLTKYGSKKYNHKTGEYEDVEDWDVFDYKLETLCEYYDIYRSDAHRSLSDTYATALLFKNLIADKTS